MNKMFFLKCNIFEGEIPKKGVGVGAGIGRGAGDFKQYRSDTCAGEGARVG